jgi:hypothetical protein
MKGAQVGTKEPVKQSLLVGQMVVYSNVSKPWWPQTSEKGALHRAFCSNAGK